MIVRANYAIQTAFLMLFPALEHHFRLPLFRWYLILLRRSLKQRRRQSFKVFLPLQPSWYSCFIKPHKQVDQSMDRDSESEKHNRNSHKYLEQVRDSYTINPATGLYEPKTYEEKPEIQEDRTGKIEGSPYFITAKTILPELSVKRDWMDKSVPFFSGAGLLIALLSMVISAVTTALLICTVIFARKQWVEMHNATIQSTRSVEIATNALDENKRQFQKTLKQSASALQLDQRPWLSIKDITCGTCETIGGGPHGGTLYDWITTIRNLRTKVANTGKTPAEDVKVDCNVHIGGISYNFSKCAATPGGCLPFQFDSRNLRNFQDRGRAGSFPVPAMDIGSIGPTQEKPVILNPTEPSHTIGLTRDSEASVYVEGTISYHSAWGSSGETKFCFFPKLSRGPTTKKEPAKKEPANEEPANDNYCDNPGSNTMR
jgi:hypothetical protein